MFSTTIRAAAVLALATAALHAHAWQQDQQQQQQQGQQQRQAQEQQALGGEGGAGGVGNGGSVGGSRAWALGLAAGGTNAPDAIPPCSSIVIAEGQRAYAHGFGLTAKGVGSYRADLDDDCLKKDLAHLRSRLKLLREFGALPSQAAPAAPTVAPVVIPAEPTAAGPVNTIDDSTRQRALAAAGKPPKRKRVAEKTPVVNMAKEDCRIKVPVTVLVCGELGATAKVVQ